MRRIDRLSCLLSGSVLFIFLFVFTQPVSAVIYKWKNEKGNSYFTDDLNTIPLEYRSKATVEIMRGMGEPPPSKPLDADKSAPDEAKEKKTSKTAELAKGDKRAAVKKKLLTEKLGIQDAIAHLENEGKRDEQLLTSIPPTMINGKYYVAGIKQLLPAKKALFDKIDKTELPILKATRDFLATSIAQDEQEKVLEEEAMLTQVTLLSDRLKVEQLKITQLKEQLTLELGKVEQALAAPEPLDTAEELPEIPGKISERAVDTENLPLEGSAGGVKKSDRQE